MQYCIKLRNALQLVRHIITMFIFKFNTSNISKYNGQISATYKCTNDNITIYRIKQMPKIMQ